MSSTRKTTQSIDSMILAAIRGQGRGSVFVPADFLDLGSREAVDIVLYRLGRKGTSADLPVECTTFRKNTPFWGRSRRPPMR